MAEAQKGSATLEDVDRDTFVRFIEWAHKGFYTAAKFTTVVEDGSDSAGLRTKDKRIAKSPVHMMDVTAVEDDDQMFASVEVHPTPVIEEYDSWGNLGMKSKKGKPNKRDLWQEPEHVTSRTAKEDMWHSFISRERKSATKGQPIRGNKSSAEVYSDVFLSHACLYVFAEKWDIQELKMLALDELHATLKKYNLYTERTSDIINLLRYVYCNKEPSEGVENLRTLMRLYVGCKMDILTYDQDFRDLMIEDGKDEKDGGALLSDFMTMVGRRISEDK